MLTRGLHKDGLTLISILFLVSVSFAVIILDTVRYEHPVRSIHGRVTALGNPLSSVMVDVYDNAQIRLDDSMSLVEQRKRQTQVASVQPNEKGEFRFQHLPKGFYEVEIGNHGGGGYDALSVLINVDPKGTNDKLCVELRLESGPGHNAAKKCGER